MNRSFVFVVLSLVPFCGAIYGQSDDCNRYCRTASGALVICQPDSLEEAMFENDAHYSQHEPFFNCTNFGDNSDYEALCTRSYLNGAENRVDCHDHYCSVSGKIKCPLPGGGSALHAYEMGCGGGGHPLAAAFRDAAWCAAGGSNGYSNSVSCGDDGNLHWGSTN